MLVVTVVDVRIVVVGDGVVVCFGRVVVGDSCSSW